MNINIIGGNWDSNGGRGSSVIFKMTDEFNTILGPENIYMQNGGHIDNLPVSNNSGLTFWMPNIPNEEAKNYPTKSVGTCLIVSKVVRPEESEKAGEHKFTQAVARIFKMNGNAVIAIETGDNGFVFTLIDALGNIWVSTDDIKTLVKTSIEFYEWHCKQERVSVPKCKPRYLDIKTDESELNRFMEVVRSNATRIMNNSGERYFGNCSTRCMLSFPSVRPNKKRHVILVSPRNSNKSELETSDLVVIAEGKIDSDLPKPSVDTPVQLALYDHFKNINYMIHGHAFFTENVRTTDNYYACGDMREVSSIINAIGNPEATSFVINLKNHGYLIATNTVEQMEAITTTMIPEMKPFRPV